MTQGLRETYWHVVSISYKFYNSLKKKIGPTERFSNCECEWWNGVNGDCFFIMLKKIKCFTPYIFIMLKHLINLTIHFKNISTRKITPCWMFCVFN